MLSEKTIFLQLNSIEIKQENFAKKYYVIFINYNRGTSAVSCAFCNNSGLGYRYTSILAFQLNYLLQDNSYFLGRI